ncbi:cuticle protein-like [Aethina tumida]|uniref:cuticle protein-like n=1 Tax=Aethina tumida TaxID=116153 RepID=UPI00096B17C8|nr:cuticle protein-like [Aethina tumida]
MTSSIIVLAALFAVSQASYLGYSSVGLPAPAYPYYGGAVARVSHVPVVAPVTKTVVSEAPAEYDFGYSVSDPYAAQYQSRVESRRGHEVAGSYSFVDADGHTRVVDYTAGVGGFKPIVRKI